VLFSKLNPRISRVWHVDDAFPYRRICSTEFLPLVARSAHALPAYIALVLQEPEVIGRLRAKVAAATKSRERLGPALVLDAEVPLPALDQQRRLVALFMDQMAAVERARAAAGAQLEAARAFPRACLRAAFESDATREWVQVRLGDLALSIQNGIYKVAHHYGHGMPLLRMYNLQRGSWCLDLGRLALAELSGAEATTFQVMPGDLLISRVNSFELVGKCSLVDERAAGFAFENMLIRVRLGEGVEPLFIAQQLSADRIRKQIKGLAKRAIGQASINCDDIRQLELLLPPLSTQRRIATDLARRNLEAEVLKKRLETEFEVVAAFPAALLRRAFSGEL
jgi:type I restriction enzyme S subunit